MVWELTQAPGNVLELENPHKTIWGACISSQPLPDREADVTTAAGQLCPDTMATHSPLCSGSLLLQMGWGKH